MIKQENSIFLNSVFDHILSIANGQCTLTDEYIFSQENDLHQKVLEGLLSLHQDLELYKLELRDAIETEYKLKVLEEKNKQLEQFRFAASHDLKEPLRTICSFSSLILKSNSHNLDASGKEYLNFVLDGSQRMWGLINGLSKYTEIGKDQTTSEVDIKKLVNNTCQDLSVQITERKVQFDIGLLPTIIGYKIELRQLFQNLIINAIKFCKPDQNLLIKIKHQKSENGHLFSIEDNGIGIDTNHLQLVFKIFKRLNRREEFEGNGIGLALCQRIVAMHYGNIWVESEKGKGSKFLFTISDKINTIN